MSLHGMHAANDDREEIGQASVSEPSKSAWERAYEESIEREEMATKPILTESFLAFSDRIRDLILISAFGGVAIGLTAELLGVDRSGVGTIGWIGAGVTGAAVALVWWWRGRRRNREWDDWPPRG
jgi:hypothetical protein